jgi:hypothetical protein
MSFFWTDWSMKPSEERTVAESWARESPNQFMAPGQDPWVAWRIILFIELEFGRSAGA